MAALNMERIRNFYLPKLEAARRGAETATGSHKAAEPVPHGGGRRAARSNARLSMIFAVPGQLGRARDRAPQIFLQITYWFLPVST